MSITSASFHSIAGYSAQSSSRFSPKPMIRFGEPFPERLQTNSDCVPTPPQIVEKLIEAADIKPGMSVLEPHAGTGNIAGLLKDIPNIKLFIGEYDPGLRSQLIKKGYHLVSTDFFEHQGQYDRIIMNPPYSNKQAAFHVKHAYNQLKPGGKLLAIIPKGIFTNPHVSTNHFENWLKKTPEKFEWEDLHKKVFKNEESRVVFKTGILSITKPKIPCHDSGLANQPCSYGLFLEEKPNVQILQSI